MSSPFFTSVRKTLHASTTEVRSVMADERLDSNMRGAIQDLRIEECSAVAGGPQVVNEPGQQ